MKNLIFDLENEGLTYARVNMVIVVMATAKRLSLSFYCDVLL